MNPLGKARKRLRLTLVVAMLLLEAGVGYDIWISPPMYLESATVEFSLPKTLNAPNAYYMFAHSLITSDEVTVQILNSPSAQRQIGAAGRGASVSLALVNLYNEEYPNYGVPLATLTAASPVAADAHRTFVVAVRVLGVLLAAQQKQAGVPPRERISAQVLGDSGPIIQTGSRARVFGGLALLAAIAAGLAWNGAGRWGAERRASRQGRLSRYHCTVARRPAGNGVRGHSHGRAAPSRRGCSGGSWPLRSSTRVTMSQLAAAVQQRPRELEVVQLHVTGDVVDAPALASLEGKLDGVAVVVHMERDDLLGELVRTVVVDAPRDEDIEPVGLEVGAGHEVPPRPGFS
jgi:hypothetical protein